MKFIVLAAAVLMTAAAHAQTDPTITSRAALEQARAALASGNAADAERFLAQVDETKVDINDVDFLHGMLAVEKKQYRAAAGIGISISAPASPPTATSTSPPRPNRLKSSDCRSRSMTRPAPPPAWASP